MKRTTWQAEADRRWPNGMDMVDVAFGDGQWATVAWCAGLTVHLHRTERGAVNALAAIDRFACGHGCWRDHELVDLTKPTPPGPADRGARRAAHGRSCRVCQYVYSGQMPDAALVRS